MSIEEREDYSGLGEIEERREPCMPGSGFSRGNPNRPAQPRQSIPVSSGTISGFLVGVNAVKILPANRLRATLHFQNRSAATIWLSVRQTMPDFSGTPPVSAWELPSGAVWEPQMSGFPVFWDDVYSVASAADSLLSIIETIRTTS